MAPSGPLYVTIYDALLSQLQLGALRSGLVLGEVAVAAAFTVSRIPAPAALK
jgi:DNA-binding GntR family transcriptional regulator